MGMRNFLLLAGLFASSGSLAQTTDSIGNARKAAAVEQTRAGDRPAPELVASFDGLGEGFRGPQGTALYRNPSDNALAVGPDHIFQIVNTRMAI